MPLSHLTLVVPDLLWADPDLRREATRELPLPALGWLLGRGQARAQAQSASACLAELFAAPADLPVARALARADGLAADDGHWLCADPVHLRVEQDYLLLADARMFALNQAEADALVASLNSHFGQDGLCFYAPTPNRWYLRLDAASAAEFTPLAEAAAQNIDFHLPRGERASYWRHMLNELQMLLFNHPVNEAREQAGAPVINSVWPWGQGDAALRAPTAQLWADSPLPLALASQAGARAASAPAQLDAAWLAAQSGEALIWLDTLSGVLRYQDGYGWRQRLQALEADYFAPLAQALKTGQLGQLTLRSPGEAGFCAQLGAAERWKFWRSPRTLAELT